jgi:hypothetical protein
MYEEPKNVCGVCKARFHNKPDLYRHWKNECRFGIDNCPLCNKPILETDIAVSSTETSRTYHSKCFTSWAVKNRK